MEEYLKDERFKSILTDPKLRNVPKSRRKVKIDKRFQSMFTDKNFQLTYTVDKRGKPIRESNAENFRKYYDLSSEEEFDVSSDTDTNEGNILLSEEKKKHSPKLKTKTNQETVNDISINNESLEVLNDSEFKDHLINETIEDTELTTNKDEYDVTKEKLDEKIKSRLQDMSLDYARGIGALLSESSSDESSSEESETEAIEHPWGELDKDAELVDEVTRRLAVCHMDWDRITAADLMVLFNSFLPAGGIIEAVTIYPSEFGLQRLKEEELQGPKELVEQKAYLDESDEEGIEGSGYHMEKLREYQLKRLKYYYAVLECDNPETANKLYTECDGMEYESTATRLDLRFIPDDMVFDQKPKEVCNSMPDSAKYKPRLFANTALQQGKVDLTWDETDPNRVDLTKKIIAGEELQDDDLKAYIATSSSEEDNSDESGGKIGEENSDVEGSTYEENDKISKYRSLLASIQSEKEKKEKEDVEMEISWDVGLQDKAKGLVDQKMKEKLTPFEKIIEEKKERRKQKMRPDPKNDDNFLCDQDAQSGTSSDDEIIKQPTDNSKSKKNKKEKKTLENDDEKQKAELELLLAENSDAKQHFSLKSIQERENSELKKKKWKKQLKKKEIIKEEDNFDIDVKDDRFNALYTSHHYNIDPADPHFRKTKGMERLISEKQKRKFNKLENQNMDSLYQKKPKLEDRSMDPELYKLVKSVKQKTSKK